MSLRCLRQLGHRILHPVLHQHLVHIRIGADLEGDRQHIGAVIGAGRLHVEHAGSAVHLQLDRQGDRVDHGLGAGPGITGGHLDGRRHDIRILRDRQTEEAKRADQHQHDRQHIGQDRMLDKEFRHHGFGPPAAVPGEPVDVVSNVVNCGVTLVPGLARHRSPTTTRSSSLSPEVMTREAPISCPNCT